MRNIRLVVEYDGTEYCGWQTQKTVHSRQSIVHREIKTIQETIEKTLEKILKEKVNLIVAGRTDSGVHAERQVCNFRTKSLLTPDVIKKALNHKLPKDIAIRCSEYVPPKFNSREDALSKVYRYTVLNRNHPPAINRNFVYYYSFPLDVRLMKLEAESLIGKHNFKSFQAKDIVERHPVVCLHKISIIKKGDLITIDIEADRFLYNMVRNIAGTLLEIGRGRFKPGSMKRILLKKDRSFAGPTAPARGLTLLKVKY